MADNGKVYGGDRPDPTTTLESLVNEIQQILAKSGVKFGASTSPFDVLEAARDALQGGGAVVATARRTGMQPKYGLDRGDTIREANADYDRLIAAARDGLGRPPVCRRAAFVNESLRERGLTLLTDRESLEYPVAAGE